MSACEEGMSDPVDLNQAMEPWCLDHSIEMAWDQWARVRIFCRHGTAEGVSGGLCLNQAFMQAVKSWEQIDHSAYTCHADTAPPAEWWSDPGGEYWRDHMADCELDHGHDGDHHVYVNDEQREAYLYERLVYFKNGVNRTGAPEFGSTVIPHPYLVSVTRLREEGQG